jgi:hypothetical protein
MHSVPFSTFGSYMAVAYLPGEKDRPPGLYLKSVYGGNDPLFRIEMAAGGGPVEIEAQAAPGVLTLRPAGQARKDGPQAELCFAGPDVLRIRGRGLGLRLIRQPNNYGAALPAPGLGCRVLLSGKLRQYRISPLAGHVHMDAPWQVATLWNKPFTVSTRMVASLVPDVQTGQFDVAVQEHAFDPPSDDLGGPFDACVKAAEARWAAWLKKMPSVPRAYKQAAELAMYVNWSAVVGASGKLPSPAMLMSKNHMTSVWMWDNLLNAWASSMIDPQFAWQQFMLHLEQMSPSGQVPDSLRPQVICWTYGKPPLHGWVLKRMMAQTKLDTKQLKAAYERLAPATEWWLKYRDDDGDGICNYHHGNDSGWDNGTSFDVGLPLESPDLSAFLILQMDMLAELAPKVGKAKQADGWTKRADAMLAKLIEHNWRDGRFVATRSGDHAFETEGDCLLPYEAIVLGKRLPAEVRQKMAADLAEPGRFLTPFGLASESLRSPKYHANGYWRGPIWAPAVMIIVDGLMATDAKLAREVARRYCDMCVKSGFAENFDAVTGSPLCDPAYTWASSVFLVLAANYLR